LSEGYVKISKEDLPDNDKVELDDKDVYESDENGHENGKGEYYNKLD
jgi:hypothetical protein